MHAQWPLFKLSHGIAPKTVIWTGQLYGLERPFKVTIEYGEFIRGDRLLCRMMPVVRVIEPALILNHCAAEEAPLPHVYFEPPHLERSPLCLFDPRLKEWDRTKYIANTTLPWAGRWLACYEFWEATGRWVGGGRHPGASSLQDFNVEM